MNFKLKEKMTLEQRVKPTELMAFWILVLFLFGWGIVTASFIANFLSQRKFAIKKEMDDKVIFQTIYTFTSFIDAKDPYTRSFAVKRRSLCCKEKS